MRGESEGGRVQVQMHAGIVDESGLVDVYVQSLVRSKLEGGLHAVYGERGLGIIAGESLFEMLLNLAETALVVVVLLSVVVSWNPPGRMVCGHGELCELFLDNEIVEILL